MYILKHTLINIHLLYILKIERAFGCSNVCTSSMRHKISSKGRTLVMFEKLC